MRQDGTRQFVQQVIFPIKTAKGYRIGSVTRDITERKQAERKLRESEERFAAAFHASPSLIAITRITDGTILEVNEGYSRLLGYSHAESIGKTTSELSIWADSADRTTFITSLKEFGQITDFETTLRRKDGTLITVIDSARTIKLQGELCVLSVIHDITERKRAEEQAHYQATLLANVNDAVVASNENYKLTAWNAAAESLYGWKAEEVLGRTGLEIVQTDYLNTNKDEILRTITETGKWRGEVTQARKDGTRIPVEIASMVLRDETGKVTGYVSVNRDITERKRAEEALHKSEEQYRIVADNTYDWEFWSSPDGQFLYNSPSCQRITGHTADEFAREPGLLNRIIHSEDRERFMLHYHQVMERKMPGEIEFRLLLEDGSVRHIGHVCQPVFDAQGLYLGKRGSNRDITERKQAEEALRANEARFRALVENSSEIITILNADGTARYESPAHKRLLGYTSEEMIGAYPLALVHPEDLPRLLDIFVTGIQVPKYTAQAEYRIRHKDGTWRTMEMVACNLLEDPAVEGIVINSRDITERMSAEAELAKYREHLEELVTERTQQLRESEQHHRQLFETMLQGVVYQDANGKIISMNPAAERILGVTASELLGTTSMERGNSVFREDGSVFSKSEHPASVTRLTGEEVHNVVMGIYNPRAQSQRWINVSAVPVFRAGEAKPYQVYTLFDDITERKRAEVRRITMETLRRILLVEDDPKDIELTLSALGEHNLANEVVVARDGVEALDYLHRRGSFTQRLEGNPVVILLDLKMPKMDGLQVLRQIKSDEGLRLIPVVVLTSSREDRDLTECYQLGVNAYVVKPVRFADFVQAVKGMGVFWALINEPPPGTVKKA